MTALLPRSKNMQKNLASAARTAALPQRALLAAALVLVACGPSTANHDQAPIVATSDFCGTSSGTPSSTSTPPGASGTLADLGATVAVSVAVDASVTLASVPARGFGIHASVYDNSLHNAAVPTLLNAAGVATLRWPGGGYSDNYHWSNHTMTPFSGNPDDKGYLAQGSDFGSFVQVLDSFGGNTIITVNYGSNLQGTGPGEPKEAAAWVAYANGDPSDGSLIGVDGAGNDWKTVGYWAGLRAATPLAIDDGENMLRIARSAPLGVHYWEIGNELFGNGFYQNQSYEEDLHVSYASSAVRSGNPALSPTTYGQGVVAFAAAMKAVDPSIAIGAVLNTPPDDYSWGPTWNRDVMAVAGAAADFVIVHWYPSASGDGLPSVPHVKVPQMMNALRRTLRTCAGARANDIQMAVTEMGPNSGSAIPSTQNQTIGLFAADGYATLLENGVVNVDWLELHAGGFLIDQRGAEHGGPAYEGIQMAHYLVSTGDSFVQASSSVPYALSAHAAVRADGNLSLMLVNLAPSTSANVNVTIANASLASSAQRFDYAPMGAAASGSVSGPLSVPGGNSFSVEVSAYSVVDLVIPQTN